MLRQLAVLKSFLLNELDAKQTLDPDEESAIRATLKAVENKENGKESILDKPMLFNYFIKVANWANLPVSVVIKMPFRYLSCIDNLQIYLQNSQTGKTPAMSLNEVLATTRQERWNLMSLYKLLENGNYSIQEVKALTEKERKEQALQLKNERTLGASLNQLA